MCKKALLIGAVYKNWGRSSIQELGKELETGARTTAGDMN